MIARVLRARLARETGFLMVELLMGIVFLGVIFAAFSVVMSTAITHNARTSAESVVQTELRAAADAMAAELRQAYTGDETWYPVESSSATAITFVVPDRQSPFHVRRVSYRLNGTSLERRFATTTNTGGPPWTFGATTAWVKKLGTVANTDLFTYVTESGKVKTVTIKLVVAPKSATRQITYQTSATVRQSAS